MPEGPTVRHNIGSSRYEMDVEGRVAVAEYIVEENRIILTHTYVPSELRGRGIAEKLVRAALDDARRQGQKVVPQCSYVAAFIQRHPEFQPLVAD